MGERYSFEKLLNAEEEQDVENPHCQTDKRLRRSFSNLRAFVFHIVLTSINGGLLIFLLLRHNEQHSCQPALTYSKFNLLGRFGNIH